MRILAWLHKYPPHHNAGAERMLHELLADSVARGHQVVVAARHAPRGMYEFEGVTVIGGDSFVDASPAWRACDVAVTHLDVTREAMSWARATGTRLVHVLHNDRQLRHHRVGRRDSALIVANSRWIAELVPEQYGEPAVVTPPVDPTRYTVGRGPHDRVVLLNLTEQKGVRVLYELARRLPELRFLGVRGAYGHQELPPAGLANVEIITNRVDVVAEVYPQASVVIVPSSYESWGRVAIEAMSCGVPVVRSITPGLDESCGDAAVSVPIDDIAAWATVVAAVAERGQLHEDLQERGIRRALELDPRKPGGSFDAWDAALARAVA